MTIGKAIRRLLLAALALALCVAGWWMFTTREREFTGIWTSGFENSLFVEAAEGQIQPELTITNHGWLTLGNASLPPHPCQDIQIGPDEGAAPMVYKLKFFGKRVPGVSGHLGMFPAEYFVTKIIEAEPLTSTCEKAGDGPPFD